MYNETLYHGANMERVNIMVRDQKMLLSEGDRHWLGHGSYFYEDDFNAYKWILDMYQDNKKKKLICIEDIFNEYNIIEALVVTDKSRVFNLDLEKYKMEFKKVYDKAKEKKKYSSRLSKVDIVDGVILNIMFDDLNYCEDFDLVIATFVKSKSKNKISRFNDDKHKQICVKKLEIVTLIEKYMEADVMKEYQKYIEETYTYSRGKYRYRKSW